MLFNSPINRPWHISKKSSLLKQLSHQVRKLVIKITAPVLIIIASLCLSTVLYAAPIPQQTITINSAQDIPRQGRLYIMLNRSNEAEPRFYSAWPTRDIEPLFAGDLEGISAQQNIDVSNKLIGFPHKELSALDEGAWNIQALYDTDFLDGRINSPSNYYSEVKTLLIKEGEALNVELTLNQQIPRESLPQDSEHLRFVKMKSELLTNHWQSDMYIRAAVLLPAEYSKNPLKQYPVFYSVGGYHAQYTRAQRLMENEAFQEYWFDESTPQMVMVFLDSQAPYGDSYQMDSANNGPYGQATINEFLPYLEQKFNLIGSTKGRYVSGCSTGGWVSLAMQLFYPDTFNGAWSYSADGVDFRFFQLVDIYNDDNAYVNEHGSERPSYRQTDGDVIFSIKREIMMENVMGKHNSFAFSGGQWGGWNAVYGPQNEDGTPSAIWDPVSGKVNKEVAEQWQRFDLRKYTEDNWSTLGPKLEGKLHLWMGDMDNFYLNNAMYLYEDMLNAQTEPVSDAKFTWKRGVGHCDYNQVEMLKSTVAQMHERYLSTSTEK
jgi:esterase/lipase superfamily enzyme